MTVRSDQERLEETLGNLLGALTQLEFNPRPNRRFIEQSRAQGERILRELRLGELELRRWVPEEDEDDSTTQD